MTFILELRRWRDRQRAPPATPWKDIGLGGHGSASVCTGGRGLSGVNSSLCSTAVGYSGGLTLSSPCPLDSGLQDHLPAYAQGPSGSPQTQYPLSSETGLHTGLADSGRHIFAQRPVVLSPS